VLPAYDDESEYCPEGSYGAITTQFSFSMFEYMCGWRIRNQTVIGMKQTTTMRLPLRGIIPKQKLVLVAWTPPSMTQYMRYLVVNL